MYAELEKNSPKLLDSFVNSLSWKGDPRRGWLAVGNSRGVVGVTYTESAEVDSDSWSDTDGSELEKQCMRRNFNFTEHSQEITLVRWNKSLDKIATCDAAGSVIVWKNHNGRSIMELVNNRGVSIADFQWSNDGTRVLISYVDGYVLLGTAFGRRLWARQLSIGSFVTNPASQSQQSRLLSSTWSPDDSKVVVGSSIGELIELDVENGGSLVSTTEVLPGIGIIGLQWVKSPGNNKSSTSNTRDRLSLYLRNGKVVLMSSCGDQQATIIRTGLLDGQMQWNETGSILAVAGYRKSQGISTVRFFKPTGQLLFTLPLNTKDPIGAMTWGHMGRHLFVAARNQLFTVNVHQTIPSLQYLCQSAIAVNLKDKESTYDLHLPTKMKTSIVDSYSQIIQGHIPDYHNLLSYVSRPPPIGHRVFCTVAPNPTPSSPSSSRNRHINSYTLYVEHLGSLYPILTAHKSGKIRQCFTLSLPGEDSLANQNSSYVAMSNGADGLSASVEGINSSVDLGTSQSYEDSTTVPMGVDFSSSLPVDASSSFHRNSCRITDALFSTNGDDGQILAAVTSNVMASKFKIQGLSECLESDLGSIAIKTSFLHIQPRKVTVLLPRSELNDSGIESDSGDSSSDDEYDSVFSELPDYLVDHHPAESAQPEFDIGKHTITSSSKRISSSVESPIIVMSKTPTWNEQHMIYQLDFGGRVTAKSAKNFQLEVDNKQVLQFGRIDNGAFILDFQAPFSPIQAFATALANLV